MFMIKRKCAGMPMAANTMATVRPAFVRGTGAPKPMRKSTPQKMSQVHLRLDRSGKSKDKLNGKLSKINEKLTNN